MPKQLMLMYFYPFRMKGRKMSYKQVPTPLEYFFKTGICIGYDEKKEIIQSTDFLTSSAKFNETLDQDTEEAEFYRFVSIALHLFYGDIWINSWTWYSDYLNRYPNSEYEVKINGFGIYEVYSNMRNTIRDAEPEEISILDALGIARKYWHLGENFTGRDRVCVFKMYENLKLI